MLTTEEHCRKSQSLGTEFHSQAIHVEASVVKIFIDEEETQ
jgi:hypothetical protein